MNIRTYENKEAAKGQLTYTNTVPIENLGLVRLGYLNVWSQSVL